MDDSIKKMLTIRTFLKNVLMVSIFLYTRIIPLKLFIINFFYNKDKQYFNINCNATPFACLKSKF